MGLGMSMRRYGLKRRVVAGGVGTIQYGSAERRCRLSIAGQTVATALYKFSIFSRTHVCVHTPLLESARDATTSQNKPFGLTGTNWSCMACAEGRVGLSWILSNLGFW